MKNILVTIQDYEATTVNSPIVEKTLELASFCSSKVHIIHVATPIGEPPYSIDRSFFSPRGSRPSSLRA